MNLSQLSTGDQAIVNGITNSVNVLSTPTDAYVITLPDGQLNLGSNDYTSVYENAIINDMITRITNAINNNSYCLQVTDYKYYRTGFTGSIMMYMTITNMIGTPGLTDIASMTLCIEVDATIGNVTMTQFTNSPALTATLVDATVNA